MNEVMLTDLDLTKVYWRSKGIDLQRQHSASFTADGKILVYDNGELRKYTRIIKIDPFTKQIVWQYPKNPDKKFYASSIGAVQQLRSSNYLITDPRNFSAFEIDNNGNKVWEISTPHLKDREMDLKFPAIGIYRVMRLEDANKINKIMGK
jgi:hypothetical protein